MLRSVEGDLAEIALGAGSAREYRQATLEYVCRALSVDAVLLNHTRTGFHIDVSAIGFDEVDLGPVLPIYVNQVSSSELKRALVQRALRDEEIFSSVRRGRLRIYHEYLTPRGVSSFALCGRVAKDGLFWISIMRAGRSAQYGAKDLERLETLFPILAAGDILHRPNGASLDGIRRQAARWLAEGFVTLDQCRLMELLERGLTISDLCRLLAVEEDVVRRRIADLIETLRRRLEGGLLVTACGRGLLEPASISVKVNDQLPDVSERHDREQGLSRRAGQTLELLRQGLSDKEIAAHLGLSPHTVNQYTKTIYAHFGVHSRSTLIAQLLGTTRARSSA
jgi:DNA-binding CsgD family transcriptional regulator